jgi:cobalt-zinc-cadmium efflux system membrane fusion protein
MTCIGIRLAIALSLVASTSCSSEDSSSAGVGAPVVRREEGVVSFASGSPMLERIRVEPAERRRLALDIVTAPARIEADPARRARIRLPVPGRIAGIQVRAGDAVDAQQLLLTVESGEAEVLVAAYRQARAAEERARSDLARVTDLYEFDGASRREVIAARTELAQLRAERVQTERSVRILGLDPERPAQKLDVVTPIAGRVLALDVGVGEFHADHEEPVATIADLRRVWAVAGVPESSLRQIHAQDEVRVSLFAYPDEEFLGRVVRIADVVDPETRTVAVYVELDNPDGRLRPEMFGTVELLGGVRELAAVPPGAIVHRRGDALVLVETKPGTFETRVVRAGPRNGERIPIREGLEPGERVVVEGAMLLLGTGRPR